MTFDPIDRDTVRAALDDCLSGLNQVPSRRAEILSRVKGETKVKKKLSAGFVLAMVLTLLMASVAVAAGLGLFGRLVGQDEDARLENLGRVSDTVGMSFETNEGATLTIDQAYYDGTRVFLSYVLTGPIQSAELGEGTPDNDQWDEIDPGVIFAESACIDGTQGKKITQWLDGSAPRWAHRVSIGTYDGLELPDGTYCEIIGGTSYEQEDGSHIGWKECIVPPEAAADEITVCIGVYRTETLYYQTESALHTRNLNGLKGTYYPFTIRKDTSVTHLTGATAGEDWSATADMTLSQVDLRGTVTVACPESWRLYEPEWNTWVANAPDVTDWVLYANGQPVDNENTDWSLDAHQEGKLIFSLCWRVDDMDAAYMLVPTIKGSGDQPELGIVLTK